MYAIVEIGGMQFKVDGKVTIRVPRMENKPGDKVKLDRVLMTVNGDKVEIGKPYLSSVSIPATVVSHGKDKKVQVFKKKRRKGYKVHRGHRQEYTELRIELGGPATKARSAEAVKAKATAKKSVTADTAKGKPAKKTAAGAKPAEKKTDVSKKPSAKPAAKKEQKKPAAPRTAAAKRSGSKSQGGSKSPAATKKQATPKTGTSGKKKEG
jgi:large subunit ribosomal protein L21